MSRNGFEPVRARRWLKTGVPLAAVGVLVAALLGTLPNAAWRSSAATPPGAKHVFVVMMENTDWASVKGSSSFPYVNQTLLPNFASADGYNSGLHPSLPNYVELEAGATLGLTDGSYLPDTHAVTTTAHLTTQLTSAGLDWKYYAENLPGNGATCNLSDPGTPYSEDHNPFVYFTDVQSNPAYCIQHERPYSELSGDLSAGSVPDYSFIVPNDWHQGEKLAPGSSCLRCQADDFLKTEIPMIQASAAYKANGIILVLWDESGNRSANTNGLIVVSNLAKKGYSNSIAYNHGSTLRTVQAVFGLSPFLGDAATSTDLGDLFASSPFDGGGPATAPSAAFTETPTSGSSPLAVSFSDGSSGSPTSWSWTFGDGGTSAVQSPSHTYTAPGTYSVSLTATNAAGSSTATQTNAITVLATQPSPSAAFVATPSSGTAPLTVSFTDTSGGAPTSWSWAFGDGGSSTSQNPSHIYAAAGTFTATLTATNATGSGTATHTVTVASAPPPATGGVTAGSSTTATAVTAKSGITLSKPAGVVDGDVLIATINADANPTMATVPSGWRAVTGPLSVSTSARIFSYYRVVASASAEPPQYAFKLSAAKAWNAGVTAFHGVNRTTPFDTAATTKVVTSSTTAITVPSVTTVTPGAMLVGGVGLNSVVAVIAPPVRWTEAWEADGGQNAELGYRAMPVAGASGSSAWTLSVPKPGAAWVRALRPA